MDLPHLKIKQLDNSLIKNYCIFIRIQKISLIHRFILKIQQILGSYELKGPDHFKHTHAEIMPYQIFDQLSVFMDLH